MKKKRIKIGSVYEIPLPNGLNAYGRLFKEYTLGIYRNFYKTVDELPEDEEYIFFVAVYKDLLQDGEWRVVAERKFENEDDAWPPRRCLVDSLSHVGSIYYKGEIIRCTYEECKDLEIVSVWDRQHVIDRLMGDNKWLQSLGKPINPNE